MIYLDTPLDWLSKILTKQRQRIGLKLNGACLHYCVFDTQPSGSTISAIGRLNLSEQNQKAAFVDTMQRLHTKGREALWVLPNNRYRVITIERPAVRDEELQDALQWQIKDYIDIPLDEAVITYYDYPEDIPGPRRINVVVAEKSEIKKLVEFSQAAGLSVHSIGIQELILGQIVDGFLQQGQNLAFLSNTSNGLSVHCFLSDSFVFTRCMPNVRLPYTATQHLDIALDLAPDKTNIDVPFDADHFLLEVQRTLDYYESQIAKRAITKIVIPYLGSDSEQTAGTLASELGLQVHLLRLDEICRWSDDINEATLYDELTVCAAALQPTENRYAEG